MENVKYTSDGKKVVIIGNLNSQEKIVQEVFVVNGQEVPSGENFVVKSLHDAPAVSWKEKNLKDIETKYERRKAEIDNSLKALEDRYRISKASIDQKCQYLRKHIDNVTVDSFDVLTKFLKGEIKYVVCGGWSPKILDYNKEEMDTSFGDRDLKLLTLFGRSDGTLTWGINRYRDGSGGDSTWCGVATSYDEAKELLTNAIKEYGRINEYVINEAKKHNIELDLEMVGAYKEKRKAEILKSIESKKKEVEKYESDITELENL